MLEIAPKFLKGLLYASKWISKCLRDYLIGFRVNSLGSEIGPLWAKSLGYSPCFEHGGFWQVLEIAPNCLKGLLYAYKWISKCLPDNLIGFRVNSLGSEIGPLWAKSMGYSPCFWTWRILASVGNRSKFLKGLLYASKWISKCLRDYFKWFRVNSLGSEIGRFWAKSLGYSPCFWTWRILASVGKRSKLSERTPYCLEMNF